MLEPSERLTRDDQLALFAALTEELARKGELYDAITDGLTARQVWRLAKHAAGHLREEHDMYLALDRPFRKDMPADFDAVAADIERGTCNRAAYIIEIRERKYHWTVVRGVTAKSLLLFDSAGITLMRQARCRIGSNAEIDKHIIRATSVIRVSQMT